MSSVLIRDFEQASSLIEESKPMSTTTNDAEFITRITNTHGVCGGNARIVGTRMPVWGLVASRESGCTDEQILMNYPFLTKYDIDAAWQYDKFHEDEIRQQIQENQDV